MKVTTAALVVLVGAVTVASVAAAGPGKTKQRVAIESRIIPQSTFVLTPLQGGAVKRDSGTVGGNWRSIPGRMVMRAGQEVTVFNVLWTFTGKQGTLTIRERSEWVAAGYDDGVALGTWKVVRGTGQYAELTGSGGSGHAGLGSPWYARYEGLITSP
jgi:hypothetical protein